MLMNTTFLEDSFLIKWQSREEAETEILLTMELGRVRLTMEKQGIAVDGYLDLKERGLL